MKNTTKGMPVCNNCTATPRKHGFSCFPPFQTHCIPGIVNNSVNHFFFSWPVLRSFSLVLSPQVARSLPVPKTLILPYFLYNHGPSVKEDYIVSRVPFIKNDRQNCLKETIIQLKRKHSLSLLYSFFFFWSKIIVA